MQSVIISLQDCTLPKKIKVSKKMRSARTTHVNFAHLRSLYHKQFNMSIYYFRNSIVFLPIFVVLLKKGSDFDGDGMEKRYQ